MPAQIGYFDTLKSVAGKVFTYLASITLTGTDGKTITCTQNTSLDEAVAMSSKAPKTDTVKGDGTAGRVLRSTFVVIENATQEAKIKCSSGPSVGWVGDANAAQDNIGKDGVTTGVWSLDVAGDTVTLLDAGITGTIISVLMSSIIYNLSGTALQVNARIIGANMVLDFLNSVGGAVDLTTLVDTGQIQTRVLYVTSA